MLTLPIPVSRALRKLGHDIKDARRRRRIPMAIAAERASISKPTFIRVERGDPSVSIGSYATVLYVLGMADRLGDLAARKTTRWACSSKRKTCRSAFAARANRNARKTNDGPRNPCVRGPRRRPPPDGAAVGARAQEQGKRDLRIRRELGWKHPARFSLEPALQLGPGPFHTPADTPMFGAIGDSAPDRWGRALMRRMERRRAEREGTAPRTLQEIDFLLLVDDEARQGALRFAEREGGPFLREEGVKRIPPLVELPRLLSAAEHVMEEKDTEEDLRLLFAPGSSLGGARPKASVIEKDGHLAIAKFPRKDDEINTVVWEAVALALADKGRHRRAGEPRRDHFQETGAPAAALRPRGQTAHSVPLRHEHAGVKRQRRPKLSGNCRRAAPARGRAESRHGGAVAAAGVQYPDLEHRRPPAQSRFSLRGTGGLAALAGLRSQPGADRHQAAHPQHGDQRG